MPIALVVHGGASNIPDESVDTCLAGVRSAPEHGRRALGEGAAALDDTTFNAGHGSRLNNAGEVELDASIPQHGGFEIHVEPTDVDR